MAYANAAFSASLYGPFSKSSSASPDSPSVAPCRAACAVCERFQYSHPLMRDTSVVSVSADETFVTVVIEEKQVIIGTSRLMMMFGAKDLQLRQWTVTDPQGYDTTVAVSHLDVSKRPDPSMFRIDYTRYAQ